MKPFAVELENLSGITPQVGKFFFKRDHVFLLAGSAPSLPEAWPTAEQPILRETTRAGGHSIRPGVRVLEPHPRTDRGPETADGLRRNAAKRLRQFRAA